MFEWVVHFPRLEYLGIHSGEMPVGNYLRCDECGCAFSLLYIGTGVYFLFI